MTKRKPLSAAASRTRSSTRNWSAWCSNGCGWLSGLAQADGPAEATAALRSTEESLKRLAEAGGGPLPESCLQAVLASSPAAAERWCANRGLPSSGPLYSYSHLAAIHRFGQSVEFVPVGTSPPSLKKSTAGMPISAWCRSRTRPTAGLPTRWTCSPGCRCGFAARWKCTSITTLLGQVPAGRGSGGLQQAAGPVQCRNWLAKHLPAARTIEVTSTSTAAQLAGEKPGAAAIASLQAGVDYGLGVLAEKIEDNPGNTTRFAVIGDHTSPRTGNDQHGRAVPGRASARRAGRRHGIFKRNKLNLTWIESFPDARTERGYLFFVEMEGHESDARSPGRGRAGAKALRLEILGSFPATTRGGLTPDRGLGIGVD